MTRFAEVAAASDAAGATRSRLAKVAAFAELFARLQPDEVRPVVAMLSGAIRQGRIGVGWATVSNLSIPPATGEPSLEIDDVDAAFDRLAATIGPGSVAAREAVLHELFGQATAAEADLLRRLLTGELRHGALESLVADAVAKGAGIPVAVVRRAAMLTGDLPTMAATALHGGGRPTLEATGLSVGIAVQPMLAASAATVDEALQLTGEASVEWKLDGARIQAHRNGDDVRLFTRNLNDVTERLPGIAALVRSFPARDLVLDGEAIGWSDDGERPGVFQDTMSSFGRQAAGAGARLAAAFFDVLHVDGEDLLDRPLSERQMVLDRVAGAAAIPRLITGDAAAATAFADDALARGHEGVMVKALDSTYDAGRRGGAWRKVKPVRTLDLVVLAAEWGSGRRQGWLSNLHLGARATPEEAVATPTGGEAHAETLIPAASETPKRLVATLPGGEAQPPAAKPPLVGAPEGPEAEAGAQAPQGRSDARSRPDNYVMVGKTFKGLTDALLTWQTEQFLAREVRRDGHIVFVRPELVVEIALDGVQRSTRYPGGVALRFARVKRYRDDKGPADADTIDTVRAMLPGP